MTKPMAFRAAYSDWRLIKTRGVVQVVLEVPLADADAAYNVLGGMPDASRENWFAVAPLKDLRHPPDLKNPPAAKEPAATPPVATDKPLPEAKRMDWRELQPAAQAGIRCADPLFKQFLSRRELIAIGDDKWAANVVRDICGGIKSRSELGTNHKARVLWNQLDSEYQVWKMKERVGV